MSERKVLLIMTSGRPENGSYTRPSYLLNRRTRGIDRSWVMTCWRNRWKWKRRSKHGIWRWPLWPLKSHRSRKQNSLPNPVFSYSVRFIKTICRFIPSNNAGKPLPAGSMRKYGFRICWTIICSRDILIFPGKLLSGFIQVNNPILRNWWLIPIRRIYRIPAKTRWSGRLKYWVPAGHYISNHCPPTGLMQDPRKAAT